VSRRIIVHSLEQARAALAAAAALGTAVTVESAAGAGAYAGPLWFKALIEEARREHPTVAVSAVLDCAEEAGTALAALRAGLERVRFTGPEETRRRLAEIAEARGAAVEGASSEPALDLLAASDPEAAARAFLAGNETAA
jgi:fructose/tagatose bisphosphate aldolase